MVQLFPDAIYLDFPYVMDYNLSRLYSREFFHFVREHLTEGGYAVFDAPNSDLFGRDEFRAPVMDPSSDWPFYYETLKGAGFDTIVPFVSALDVDNPAAREALRPLLEPHGLTGDAGVAWTFERISDHVDALMQGFILARHGPSRGRPQYRDLGIKLHVLNETRFQLAFEQPYPMRAGVDVRRVNSIVRPTMRPWPGRTFELPGRTRRAVAHLLRVRRKRRANTRLLAHRRPRPLSPVHVFRLEPLTDAGAPEGQVVASSAPLNVCLIGTRCATLDL